MKKKQREIKPVEEVNQNILNIITPSGIDFTNTYANIGDNIGRIYCISKYPANTDYGWLASLANLEGTITCIEYRYTSPERMQQVMNKKISELKTNADTAKEESDRQKYEQGVKDLREMINRISVRMEPVGYVNIMIFPQALTMQELNARIKRISSVIAMEECNIRNLKYRQEKALKAISPYGIPDAENVSNMGERNMPISTFIGGFPMAAAGLNDKGGYYLGKTKNNRTVIVNQWLRGKDRTNSNWFISGIPGTGKSTAVKDILTSEYAFRTKIIIFDPEREYSDLARNPLIQGQVLSGAGGENGRINPLQIRTAPKIEQEDLSDTEQAEDFFSYNSENGMSDMALYIQQLRVFFLLYFGKENFTLDIKTVLELCLIELYNSKNIFWNTDISKLKTTDFPIMSDLYAWVKNKAEQEKEIYMKDLYRKLEMLLHSVGAGADSFLWNGHTTLDASSGFTDIDCSGLLDLDDNVKRAQFYNLTMWGWQQMSADRNEKVIVVVDEGYLFVDPDYPDLMKFFRNISKRDRKYEGSLMFITHSVGDILDPTVKRFGQALIDNACYKLIMGTDGKNLKETKEILNLSEREETILASKNRGQAIFFVGGVRLDLRIDVSDEFLEMFGTAGGR